MKYIKISADPFRHASSACDKLLRRRVGADTHNDPLMHRPAWAETFSFDIVVKGAVDRAGNILQRHLAKRYEIAAAEEICQGGIDAVRRIDIASLHARLECLWSDVDHNDLVCPLQDPVRHSLTYGNSGQTLDNRRDALNVLDVDGREYINLL